MNDMETLIEERGELTEALADCDRGAFPGSKEEREETRCLIALDDFDNVHPEVSNELRQRRSQRIGNSGKWI